MKILRIKTFNSTNVELLDRKVNLFLEELQTKEGFIFVKIEPFMAATTVGSSPYKSAVFVGCQIQYFEEAEVTTQMKMDILKEALAPAT